jgi:hypothetical protein
MVGDGIRLPNDSTVASTKVHRGTGLPEAPARYETSAKPVLTSPLFTVVLEAKTIAEGSKGGLYEIILQNDPKSAPPITVQSSSYVKPGTSMFLELNEQQIYRPVNQLSSEQFTRLAAIELDFWRAHVLPKADSQQANNLPGTSALNQVAENHPALKPLVQWLNQRPTELNGSLVQRWIQEFAPLPTQKSLAVPELTPVQQPQTKSQPAATPSLASRSPLSNDASQPQPSIQTTTAIQTAASAAETTMAPRVNIQLTQATANSGTIPNPANQQPQQPGQTMSPDAQQPNRHHHLTIPETDSKAPVNPLEITISQWINKIDQLIQSSPQDLQRLLKQTALQELERQTDLPHQTIKTSSSPADDTQLLNLRNWLESSQARIQNLAVQTAAQHWAAPEQPTVHQMQLPLIWLGLTSWADIEWWQEKPRKEKTEKEKKDKQDRHWRMKIFLTMPPLSPLCADIDYHNDHTALTFWSEDAATLAHMNSLLTNLHQWTAGLGERTLQTKHGMPKRVNEDKQSYRDNHLVDIHT